jgi:hypothetical protein
MSNTLDEVDLISAKSGARLRRLSVIAENAIDHYPKWAFTSVSMLYFLVFIVLSYFKLLWLDELITLHIARLGTVSSIWHALALGADPNPPITVLLVRASESIFGAHELAYRLPAAIGYWVGLLSLFLYLRRYLRSIWALCGTVLSMTMAAFDYSYESRSYGVIYGLAMLGFLCWSYSEESNRTAKARLLAAVGMTFALTVGISTNYFAVLALLPIAAGEVVRTIEQWRGIALLPRSQPDGTRVPFVKAIDFRVWIGLAVAAGSILAYRPLIARSIAQFAPYAWNKVSIQQVFDSYTEMVEVVLYPILALFVFGLVILLLARRASWLCSLCHARLLRGWLAGSRINIPSHEAVGILLLMAYPFLGYVIASIRGGMLSPRFVIPVCFGFAISATLIAFRLFGNLPQAGVVFLCFVLAWFICRESVVGYWYHEQKQSLYKILDRLPEALLSIPPGAPIAIPDPLLVLTLHHYASAPIAARIVFPVDFPAIRHYRHDDSPEENLWAGRSSIYPLPIVPLANFQNSAGKYLIIASKRNWLLQDLGRHRYPVQQLPIKSGATHIGGFTPLAHGTPGFYTSSGELAVEYILPSSLLPVPFREEDNLPSATYLLPDGASR